MGDGKATHVSLLLLLNIGKRVTFGASRFNVFFSLLISAGSYLSSLN